MCAGDFFPFQSSSGAFVFLIEFTGEGIEHGVDEGPMGRVLEDGFYCGEALVDGRVCCVSDGLYGRVLAVDVQVGEVSWFVGWAVRAFLEVGVIWVKVFRCFVRVDAGEPEFCKGGVAV